MTTYRKALKNIKISMASFNKNTKTSSKIRRKKQGKAKLKTRRQREYLNLK
jgi:hypothetical protein